RRWARRTGLPSCVASVARRLGGEGAFSERALALFTRSLGSIGFPQQAGKRLPPAGHGSSRQRHGLVRITSAPHSRTPVRLTPSSTRHAHAFVSHPCVAAGRCAAAEDYCHQRSAAPATVR